MPVRQIDLAAPLEHGGVVRFEPEGVGIGGDGEFIEALVGMGLGIGHVIVESERFGYDIFLGLIIRRRRGDLHLGRRFFRCRSGRNYRRDGLHTGAGEGFAGDGQVMLNLGILGIDRRRGLVIGDCPVGKALGRISVAATLERVGMFRVEADCGIEVGDGLMDEADLQIGEAAIGEGAEMVGLIVYGGGEIGNRAVVKIEAAIGQATPVEDFVIPRIEFQSGVVIVDGALEETLARIGDAAIVIGAEIVRVELDGVFKLDDGAVVEALVVEREPSVVIDEHQVLRGQAAVFDGFAIEANRFVEIARALRLERLARIIKSVGLCRSRHGQEGNRDQQPTNHR